MALIHVPTFFAVYAVTDMQSGTLDFVRECKTKGEAVEWISKSGDKEVTYCIREYLRKQ